MQPRPAPGAGLVACPGARIEGITMDRQERHAAGVVEDLLRAVAMVDVEIDDQDPVEVEMRARASAAATATLA